MERDMLRYAEDLRLPAVLVAAGLMSCMASSSAGADTSVPPSTVQPIQVIGSLEEAFGVHPGQRRNHTKGTCAVGEFVGTPVPLTARLGWQPRRTHQRRLEEQRRREGP
jgi:hypothetical protein